MNTFIALFRGINVGGNSMLPMKELAGILEGLGFSDVKTYIQSGNAVFRGEDKDASLLSAEIRAAVRKSRGIAPAVLVITPAELAKAMESNPFPEAEAEPGTLHLGFLASEPPSPDLAGLEAARAGRERFRLVGTVFYLHAPDGVGRSKLAANAEKLLGVPATDRNWNTVRKLAEMAEAKNGA